MLEWLHYRMNILDIAIDVTIHVICLIRFAIISWSGYSAFKAAVFGNRLGDDLGWLLMVRHKLLKS